MADWQWAVPGRGPLWCRGRYPITQPAGDMNHRRHWKADPVSMSHQNDTRLNRCLVHKGADLVHHMGGWSYTTPGKWEVHLQERNSSAHQWNSVDVYRYDEFENAIIFAAIFNKRMP